MPGKPTDSLKPDEFLPDEELGFGEAELSVEPLDAPAPAKADRATEPPAAIEDADVPLDVEPDPGHGMSPDVVDYEAELQQQPADMGTADEDLERLRLEAQAALAEAQKQRARADAAEKQLTARAAMVDKAQLDAAEQQLSALQAEVSRLKRDVVEARKAAPAASGDEGLKREIAELREEVVTAHQLVEAKLAEIEQITHELVAARAELADRARAAESRTADMKALQQQLAEAVQRAEQNAAEAGRVPALEDRITAMQEQFNAKDNEVAELQEKLDTEAARSYRLSQRRIPALNKEIEDAQENAREMERKLQKAELRSQTLDDQATELRARVADLESALTGAKARAQDTQIVAPADMDSRAVAEDELRRAASRLREVEAERSQLAESLRRIGDAHGLELGRHSTRADKLEKDAEQRLQELLGQRAALRSMRERVQHMLHVAEDLASAKDGQRKVLIDALRKLAELPPEKSGA